MTPIEKSFKSDELFKYREEVLKKRKMGKLEKQIDKFLTENNVEYHRQFPVRIGRRHKHSRYAMSFFLPKQMIALDIADLDTADMSLYEVTRGKKLIFSPWFKLNMILPIDEKMPWREVKKQLTMIIAM